MDLTDEDIALADKRGAQRQSHYPRASSVRYDRRIGRLVVQLESGLGLIMSLKDLQGLENARIEDLEGADISPSGLGIHFPKLDVDLSIPGLLEGYLGTKSWMASKAGKAGGKVSTEAKAAAARENGRRGGRPKKNTERLVA